MPGALGLSPRMISTRRPCLGFTRASPVVLVRCTAETKPAVETLFRQRLSEKGWKFPPKRPHRLVAETWEAVHQVYSSVFETPLEPSPWLAQQSEGCTVCLKLENKQTTGSFKARGAVHKVMSLSPDQLAAGVVTSSTGNHALAVVHACKAAGEQVAGRQVPLTIYLPTTASPTKVAKLREAGALIVFHGQDAVETEREARRAAEQRGAVYVSPYNDWRVAGGQGTLAVELLMQLPAGKLDAVFVPVGGGGLMAGVAAVLKAASPDIRVIGCQPEVSDVMRRSVQEGGIIELDWQETLSEATAGGIEEGSVTLEPCTEHVDEWVTVDEKEIARAMIDMYTHHGYMLEGAAGVAVAAFLRKAQEMQGRHCVVVCSGGNVSKDTMDRAYRVAGLAQ